MATSVPVNEPKNPHFKRQKGRVNHSLNAKAHNTESRANKLQKQRPTHFLALPLHNHLELRQRVAAFQEALFEAESLPSHTTQPIEFAGDQRSNIRHSYIVDGLDSSIVIDPVRMHMTLGVMALESEGEGLPEETTQEESSSRSISITKKTVSTALALLESLKPQIRNILGDQTAVNVPLEVLDILKSERLRRRKDATNGAEGDKKEPPENRVGAGVLFLGPRTSLGSPEPDEERIKLVSVCDLVHKTFKQAGYITDTRPLKLHCTILNASHRRPRRHYPFSYSDIRDSKACDLISESQICELPLTVTSRPQVSSISVGIAPQGDDPSVPIVPIERANLQQTAGRAPLVLPPPLVVNLGKWDVGEIQLWAMGSRDGEGKYISSGGIALG